MLFVRGFAEFNMPERKLIWRKNGN